MKKGFIGVLLILVLGSIGTTYGRWTDQVRIRMKQSTGNFNLHIGEEEPVYAVITNRNHEVMTEVGGVEISVSRDKKAAEILFTEVMPFELLAGGDYLLIRYLLEPAEGSVIPGTPEEPDFDRPGERVSLTGAVKGLCMDGIVYEHPGDEEFVLDFDLFHRAGWEEEQLYGYMYLQLVKESEGLPGLSEDLVIEVEEEGLRESSDDIAGTDGQYGLIVEYSGEFPLYFNQKEAAIPLNEEGG